MCWKIWKFLLLIIYDFYFVMNLRLFWLFRAIIVFKMYAFPFACVCELTEILKSKPYILQYRRLFQQINLQKANILIHFPYFDVLSTWFSSLYLSFIFVLCISVYHWLFSCFIVVWLICCLFFLSFLKCQIVFIFNFHIKLSCFFFHFYLI